MTTETDPTFESLLAFLKEERGFDFTGYKRASLMRRVQRRMDEVGSASFEEYHDRLLVHPDEFTALFNTILINVTGFFRDRDTWEHLQEQVLPVLLTRRVGQPVRAWCAGCASGEEAYSVAMALAEAMGIEEFKLRAKIYATDVDEEALAVARQAAYTDREISGVPDELRERYFERQGSKYVFRRDLRRAVIFGRNDVVQDAPISHVDLLLCRNTLMYFNAETQGRILQRLHFALRPDGVLFLGRAEMLLSHPNLFRPLDLKRRFFGKVASEAGDRRLVAVRSTTPLGVDEPEERMRLRQTAFTSSPVAQLVLDSEGRLVLATSRAAHLFGVSGRDLGRPVQDLEVSYRPVELRTHVARVAQDRQQVWLRDVTWTRGAAEPLSFDIQVTPLHDEAGSFLGTSIVFNDVTHYRRLQSELEHANRQLETAYEELQSTNEELETTNEELQSMNDELHMTTEAQREQQEHYSRLNRFMSSVLGSMNSGLAAVDQELRIVTWNARSEELWGVRADEAVGEHLFNLDIGLPLEPLRPALRRAQSAADGAPEVVRVDAVNRRGRPVVVDVTVSRLAQDGGPPAGALLVMDVVRASES